MLVREKDGFYAGQIREFPSHIALELIASGRAVNPFNEIEDPQGERVALAPDGVIEERVNQQPHAHGRRKSR
jgi:hypothetical protein